MSKKIKIGNLTIGGGEPIAIQSMTDVSAKDIVATTRQICRLRECGCDAVRIAVPDAESVEAFSRVKTNFSDFPLIADVHFDSRLAIGAIEKGADKVRINPGNMSKADLKKIADCAKMHSVPIRIGANGGSPDKEAMKKYGDKTVALVQSLMEYVGLFEKYGFYDLVLSVKSSDVAETIKCNRMIASLCDYPLHIGVTEAGLAEQAAVKNAIGIGALLVDGIGDTIRVSMTADPTDEVVVAKNILSALGLYGGLQFVSCPRCGRCSIDLTGIAREIYDYAKQTGKSMKIAVMGCEVNGPGECADADLGLAGGKGKVAFFKKGQVYKTVDERDALEQFKKEIDLL